MTRDLRVLGGSRLTALLVGVLLVPWASAADPPASARLIAERLPRIVHRGGPFLRRPEIATVTFEGDDPGVVERLEAFGAMSVRSAWWREASAGYCLGSDDCIGAVRVGPSIRLPHLLPAQVRDVDIEKLLEEEARKGVLAGLGPESLVLVYLPPGVALSDAYAPRYCEGGPRAFHRMLRAGASSFPFAVIPRCGSEADTTATASHEILEAATNPDPSAPGFRLDSNAAFTATGVEPVDVCTLLNLDRHRTVELGFRLQRAWSNHEAARGRDPCVPQVPGRPYAALVPRSAAIRLPPAETSTLLLDAASDGSISSWSVTAIDLTGDQEGTQYVDARLDKGEVSVGDVVVLSLRAVRLHPRQTSIVGLLSHVGGYAHLWPVAVNMR
jgi:hypothetical protein